MSRHPRQSHPSAMDGYRRLERTRSVAAPSHAIAATAVLEERPAAAARPARRGIGRRMAGAARLLTLVAVLATIIGTSVSLASSNGPAREHAKRSSAPAVAAPAGGSANARDADAEDAKADAREAGDAKATDEAEPVSSTTAVAAEDEAVEAVAEPTAAAAATAGSADLPRTGALDSRLVLLAGAALVLLGMALQVAGEPLPARARARA